LSFFKGRFLGEITAADIDTFVNHMGGKPLSASRKNLVIKAGTKALRWAFSKGMIESDPTRGIMLFSDDVAERPILTPTAAEALFGMEWKDGRSKTANLLAAVSGMRQGEILALRVQDIGKDCLYVRHSWRKRDRLKTTKNNEVRVVEMPFESLLLELIDTARQNPHGTGPESFVFWSEHKADMPMCGNICRDGLRDTLQKIGYNETQAKAYRFHDWRHYYTSYMMDKVTEKLLKKQTGHKTDIMLRRYGEHLISVYRERDR
jgi:integrase